MTHFHNQQLEKILNKWLLDICKCKNYLQDLQVSLKIIQITLEMEPYVLGISMYSFSYGDLSQNNMATSLIEI